MTATSEHVGAGKRSGAGALQAALFGALFFVALDLISEGMRASFADEVGVYLAGEGAGLGELGSFGLGILGTAIVQSSSAVTSMCVALTQEGVLPLLVAVGVVHGANLGTSVTSSLVAFFTELRGGRGSVRARLRAALIEPRGPGFARAVGAAVIHDMFNIVAVTLILLTIELPFGAVRAAASASASGVAELLHGASGVAEWLRWLAPGTYTRPLSAGALALGLPGWAAALAGLGLLVVALRGFTGAMRGRILGHVSAAELPAAGARLIGRTPWSTFWIGVWLTVLIQSSSASTSMVVPLAALGLFDVRRVFPFILGANLGTTTTAVLTAAGGIGSPGFSVGMTVALCHLYVNALGVILVVAVPSLYRRILAAAERIARSAAARPYTLLVYLFTLVLVAPALCLMLPTPAAATALAALLLGLLFVGGARRALA